MKKLVFAVSAAVLLGAGCNMMGNHGMSSGHGKMDGKSGHGMMGGMMMKMDANADGMLSKDEFMQAHEAMFDRMKGPNGMISLKDMADRHEKMHSRMMGKDHHMSRHGQHMDKDTK
jgi:hypothetical protein